jgi:hypothetical protein
VVRSNIKPDLSAIEHIIDAITSADFTLTASLHGAVVAAAYGKRFAVWDPGKIDVPFKWRDFSESLSLPTIFTTNVEDGIEHYETIVRSRISIPPLWTLLAVAPFAVRPNIFARVIQSDLERHGKDILEAPVSYDTMEQLLYEAANSRFADDPKIRAYFTRARSLESLPSAIDRRIRWLRSTVKTWLRVAR